MPCATKAVKARRSSPARTRSTNLPANITTTFLDVKTTSSAVVAPSNVTAFSRTNATAVSSSMDVSPSKSDGVSVSLDETMSTCDSFKSPDVEYLDNNDISAVDSVERKTKSSLCISGHAPISSQAPIKGEFMVKCHELRVAAYLECYELIILYNFLISCLISLAGSICNREVLAEMETDGDIIDVDADFMDPQQCATIACDIYKHLRASEVMIFFFCSKNLF